MLKQIDELCVSTEGRYASDAELMFLQDYLKTAKLRFLVYQKIQQLEPQLIQQVLTDLKTTAPGLLRTGETDLTAKWQRDTVRTLRYAATALLLDDAEIFKERMLLWFQTVMKSFNAQPSCEATYKSLQAVVKGTFSPEEAALLLPLLEIARVTLGGVAL